MTRALLTAAEVVGRVAAHCVVFGGCVLGVLALCYAIGRCVCWVMRLDFL